MSVDTVHNEFFARHPKLLPRLYQPFWYDRHREHEDGEPTYFSAPIFEYDGAKLHARLALNEIYGGYKLRGENAASLYVELDFQPGQIQFVNNRATGHARTEFVDATDPVESDIWFALWLRDSGARSYRG